MAGLPQTWYAPPAPAPAPSLQTWDAPPAPTAAPSAPLPPPLQVASWSAAPKRMTEWQPIPAPIAPYGRLQVFSEDCEALAPPGQSPKVASSKPRARQEVYVQDLRDSGRFRPVSNRKAVLSQQRGKHDRTDAAQGRGTAGDTLRSSSAFSPESLILLDADAAFLEPMDPQDAEIAKLLSKVWQCQVLASVCCALSQALLAGLSIASLLLVTMPTEELSAFSARLWPFFGGVLLVLSEVCTFGSALSVARLLWILQASRTADEPSSGVRRRLLFAVLHTMLNTALLALLTFLSCQVSWPTSQMFLVEGLLGLAALLLSLPEAVQLMSSSPRRVFDK